MAGRGAGHRGIKDFEGKKEVMGNCARRNCTRPATVRHSLWDLPVCRWHTKGNGRNAYNFKQAHTATLFAHVQGGGVEYQGSIVQNSKANVRSLRKPKWRTREDPNETPAKAMSPDELLKRLRGVAG